MTYMVPITDTIEERSRTKRPGSLRILAVCAVIAASMVAQTCGAGSVPRMAPQELKQQIDSGDLIVIDVRISRDWKHSGTKIAGAIREDPSRVDK